MDYAVGVLAAPAIGIVSALALQQHVAQAAAPDSPAGLIASCRAENGGELCTLLTVSTALLEWSVVILVVSILLPVVCVFMIRRLAASRRLLARRLPPILRAYLCLVVAVLAAQAYLVLLSGYELFIAGVIESLYVLLFIIVLAIGFLSSAIAIVSDLPRALTVEPMQINGVVLERHAALAARVASVAGRLDTAVPEHIVIGLGPRTFATAAAMRVHGDCELNDAVTLHVSAAALHVMDAAELDALIARELGALRGEPTGVTGDLVPLCASLNTLFADTRCASTGTGSVATIARVLGNGFLRALHAALQRTQQEVALQRELEADRTALQLVSATDLASALTKAAALELRWSVFRNAYDQYMSRGNMRRNLTVDYLSHLATFADTDRLTLRTSLLAASLPDIFGGWIQLTALLSAHGVVVEDIVSAVSTRLSRVPQRDHMLAVYEERVTALENDYLRVPGQRAVLNTQESLPIELAVV
jgi:hypothetical protein